MPSALLDDLRALPYGAVVLQLESGKPIYANALAYEALGVAANGSLGEWQVSCRPEVTEAPLFDAVASVQLPDQARLRLNGSWVPLRTAPKQEPLALFVLHLTPLLHPWRQLLQDMAGTTAQALPPLPFSDEATPTATPADDAAPDSRLLWERARFNALSLAVSQGSRAVILWDAESGVINFVSDNLQQWGVQIPHPVYMEEWLSIVHPADLSELQLGRKKLLASPEADITVLSYRVCGENNSVLTLGEHSRRMPAPDDIALVCTVLENRTLPPELRRLDPLARSRSTFQP